MIPYFVDSVNSFAAFLCSFFHIFFLTEWSTSFMSTISRNFCMKIPRTQKLSASGGFYYRFPAKCAHALFPLGNHRFAADFRILNIFLPGRQRRPPLQKNVFSCLRAKACFRYIRTSAASDTTSRRHVPSPIFPH